MSIDEDRGAGPEQKHEQEQEQKQKQEQKQDQDQDQEQERKQGQEREWKRERELVEDRVLQLNALQVFELFRGLLTVVFALSSTPASQNGATAEKEASEM